MSDLDQTPGYFVALREYHRDLEDPARLEQWARRSRIIDAMYERLRTDRLLSTEPKEGN